MLKRPDIREMKIGDTVCLPLSFQSGAGPLEGKVVYIHPQLRFFTAEFICGNNRIRESYCAYGPLN